MDRWIEYEGEMLILCSEYLYGELIAFWLSRLCLRLDWVQRILLIVLPSAASFAFAMQ
jgi:hypothetical protein